MPGTMSQGDLVADLKAYLNDAASKFTAASDADFIRHLDVAASDMGRVRKRTRIGTLTLVAGQMTYPAPTDIRQPKFPLWGQNELRERKPWLSNWPGKLPRLSLIDGDGGDELALDPAPTAQQISDLGSEYKYYYFADHHVDTDAANTTIRQTDRELLLVRAAAQAMLELAHHNVTKPVQLGSRGVGAMPKNGIPAALAKDLMGQFEKMASA